MFTTRRSSPVSKVVGCRLHGHDTIPDKSRICIHITDSPSAFSSLYFQSNGYCDYCAGARNVKALLMA
jgi:hypothetical protein